MHRVNRCTLAGTVWAPTSANRAARQPMRARTAPSEPRPAPTGPQPTVTRYPGRPPYRAAARSTRPTIPRAPRPRIRPTAQSPAPTAPPSPTRCSRLPASLYIAIEQIQNRRLGRCHREVPPASPASRPPRAAIRIPLCRHRADPALIAPPIAPTACRHPHRAPSLSSRCGGPRALTGKNRTVCIPFSPNARKRPPSWQHPPEMHAFRDQNGNILAPCIHSRVQSGDSGYMARESCRQGPFFASRNPKSRMARRCCQRRAAFPRQRPAVRPNGPCAMRQRHAARGMAERALRPAARAWPACRMRAPCHLACARRRRPSPNPSQPSPGPAPTEPRPPVETSAPTRAPPPVASRPAAWVPLRFS